MDVEAGPLSLAANTCTVCMYSYHTFTAWSRGYFLCLKKIKKGQIYTFEDTERPPQDPPKSTAASKSTVVKLMSLGF